MHKKSPIFFSSLSTHTFKPFSNHQIMSAPAPAIQSQISDAICLLDSDAEEASMDSDLLDDNSLMDCLQKSSEKFASIKSDSISNNPYCYGDATPSLPSRTFDMPIADQKIGRKINKRSSLGSSVPTMCSFMSSADCSTRSIDRAPVLPSRTLNQKACSSQDSIKCADICHPMDAVKYVRAKSLDNFRAFSAPSLGFQRSASTESATRKQVYSSMRSEIEISSRRRRRSPYMDSNASIPREIIIQHPDPNGSE